MPGSGCAQSFLHELPAFIPRPRKLLLLICLLVSLLDAGSVGSWRSRSFAAAETGEHQEHAQEECSGHGRLHGNHCHCEKGYIPKGTLCLSKDEANAKTSSELPAACPRPAGMIEFERSALLRLDQGSYSLQLAGNNASMALFIIPLPGANEETFQQDLQNSRDEAMELLQDVALPRKVLKKGEILVPSEKIMYVIPRNDAEKLHQEKEKCLQTPGNVWHVDHCDGPESGHRLRVRQRLLQSSVDFSSFNLTVSTASYYALHLQLDAMEMFGMKLVNPITGEALPILDSIRLDADPPGSSSDQAGSAGTERLDEQKNEEGRSATFSDWWKTLVAVAIVTLISVIGVLLLIFKWQRLQRFINLMISIASGALFSACAMHILPESIEFYNIYGQMSTEVSLLFSTGFLVALIAEMTVTVAHSKLQRGHHHHHAAPAEAPVLTPPSEDRSSPIVNHNGTTVFEKAPAERSSVGTGAVGGLMKVDWDEVKPVAYVILLGDLFHNFVDGVLIATAFLACDSSLGISVTLSAILHEIPQEFADFVVLVDAGLSPRQALLLNLLSGLSSFLGAIIVLLAVAINQQMLGGLLAVGAGVLIYIAATDLLPRVVHGVGSWKDFFVNIMLFLVGGVVVGLSTLYHVHC